MSDELDTVPVDWAPATSDPGTKSTASAYSIESILPRGDRRFLQLREPFMVLTGNSPARAAILECAHFELARQLKSDAAGEKRDLVWREDQYSLLTGADPRSCDLWAPFQNERIVSRLYGLITEASSIANALKWLEDHDYIFRQRMGWNRNDRMVLLNVKQIQRDQRDHPAFSGHKFKPAVAGAPDQLLEEPMETIFTPLYGGLVSVVENASNRSGLSTCRAALVLQRILRRAELRDQAGESIAAPWSVRDIRSTFGWGSKDTWNAAMNQLIHSGLVLETSALRRTLSLEPNLPRIVAMARGELHPVSPLIVQNKDSDTPEQGQSYSTSGTDILHNRDGGNPEQGQGSFLSGSEVFSDCLTDYLSEREVGKGFNAQEIVNSHSDQFYVQRRAAFFIPLPFKEAWSSLSFHDIAEGNVEEAAAAICLARELETGERSAIAFPDDDQKSRAVIAVLLGYWIDTHLFEKPVEWIDVAQDSLVIGGDFSTERSSMIKRWTEPTGPLIVQGIEEARRHEQMRDNLQLAIKSHRDDERPIIFLGLPPTCGDLAKKLKEERLADLVFRTIAERSPHRANPDGTTHTESGSDNPFLG